MKRALLFAHHDAQGVVDAHVIYYLKLLRPFMEKIIFVSAGGKESIISELEGLCDYVACRPNEGYDFMSWKYALDCLREPAEFDELIFANDSVYVLADDLQPLFIKSEALQGDFWGLTRNLEHHPHLQSFFFSCRRPLVTSGVFNEFWKNVKVLPAKMDIIHTYEVGMTKKFEAAGFRVSALFSQDQLGLLQRAFSSWKNGFYKDRSIISRIKKSLRDKRHLNPMHYYWYTVLHTGLPFIKVELIRDNPCRIDMKLVATHLKKFPLERALIISHLHRAYAISGVL